MKLKQKIIIASFAVLFTVFGFNLAQPQAVSAQLANPGSQQQTFCENSYGSDLAKVQSCKDGFGGADCSSKPAGLTKTACEKGQARALCGVSGTGNATQAQRDCTSGAETCLSSGKTGNDLNQCLDDVQGVKDQVAGTCSDGSVPNRTTGKCPDGSNPTPGNGGSGTISADGGDCGGAKTVILSCNGQSGDKAIGELLKQFVLLLSLGVGILATGAIIYGAILYSSARDSASQTQQAIGVIRNAVIGIILYIFMVAIVNWLVPGGVIT